MRPEGNTALHVFRGMASNSHLCNQSSWFLWLCALVPDRVTYPHPFNQDSDLFEKSDDILAHVCQTDNDVVVVDVAESGVVSALPPGLVQNQIPAVHSGHEILVLSETAKKRFGYHLFIVAMLLYKGTLMVSQVLKTLFSTTAAKIKV